MSLMVSCLEACHCFAGDAEILRALEGIRVELLDMDFVEITPVAAESGWFEGTQVKLLWRTAAEEFVFLVLNDGRPQDDLAGTNTAKQGTWHLGESRRG